MDIKAEVKSIAKLKDYFFVVPDYQREYVWKPNDQVEQFIIDIDNEFEPNSPNQKSYFLGSIIVVENNGKFDVIDGQQRLTTLILSLCALRDILEAQVLDQKQTQYLSNISDLLSNFDMHTDETKLRLELQYEESKGYLTQKINKNPYTDEWTSSINKMDAAFERLKSHFESYLKSGLNDLTDYIKYFLTKVEMVVIESENLSSALKIFETINQRGAGLNAMDLVKNLLFSEAKEADFQKIKEIWKEIIQNLQKCNEDGSPLRFLRYFLIARYHDGVIREDEIYKWIISPAGKKSTNYENSPVEFAKELKQISSRYADLVVSTEKMNDGSRYPHVTGIGMINKYKSRQHLVLLLALNLLADDDAIEYLAEQIESYFFFNNTLGVQAKNNENFFSKWAQDLRGKKTVPEIREALKETMFPYLIAKVPTFKSAFLNINHWDYNPLYRLRYVLGKMENTINQKAGLSKKNLAFFNSLQVEHIFPQTPKNGVIPSDFSDLDEYNSVIYKLGNVTLLEGTINQAVNNFNDLSADWFQKKYSEYDKSNVVMTCLLNPEYTIGKNTALNQFKSIYSYLYNDWTKDSVLERQKVLLRLVFETWKIDGKNLSEMT